MSYEYLYCTNFCKNRTINKLYINLSNYDISTKTIETLFNECLIESLYLLNTDKHFTIITFFNQYMIHNIYMPNINEKNNYINYYKIPNVLTNLIKQI